ncbi:hypothetical protein TNCV_1215942 [Trichonephila clavipes]|nr:hypothetical protein TNCV_1215942 [Trichonephila clavipes]
MITELSSCLFRICRSLQEQDIFLVADGLQTSLEVLYRLASLAVSMHQLLFWLITELFLVYSAFAAVYRNQDIFLVADGLQTSFGGVVPPSIPCSVDASATSSGRHTHMITELSSSCLFRICRSLQEPGHLPSSRTGCRLFGGVVPPSIPLQCRCISYFFWSTQNMITELFLFIPHLPESTGTRTSSLVADGLQTSLEVNQDIFPRRGRAADFFGGVVPPSIPLQCRCISYFFWSTHTHDHRTLFLFIPHLPESTGTRTSSLVADGLNFFGGVVPPNIPCSVDASATSSGRHTHMITELLLVYSAFAGVYRNQDIFPLVADGLQTLDVLSHI